jgi:hypothetical protein
MPFNGVLRFKASGIDLELANYLLPAQLKEYLLPVAITK